MNYRRPISALFIAILLIGLGVGCSSDDDPVTPPAPVPFAVSGTVGAAGGTLTSTDGRMTLTVPAGALAAPTELSVTEIDLAVTGTDFDDFTVVKAFQILPAGIDLGPDSVWEIQLSWLASVATKRRSQVDIPVAVSSFTVDESLVRSIPDQLALLRLTPNVTTTDTDVSVRGLSGNQVAIVTVRQAGSTSLNLSVSVDQEAPASVFTGGDFALTARINISQNLSWSSGLTYRPGADLSGASTSLQDGDQVVPFGQGTDIDLSTYADFSLSYTATHPSLTKLHYGLGFDYQVDESVWAGIANLQLPIGGLDLLVYPEQLSVPVVEDPNPGGGIEEGTWPIAMTGLEGFGRLPAVTWQLENSVVGAGESGVGFYTPHSTPPFQATDSSLLAPGNLNYGTVAITIAHQFKKVPGDARIGIFGFGPAGASLTEWLPADDMFAWSQLFELGQNVTDGQPFDGDPLTEAFVYANNSANLVKILAYDGDTDQFLPEGPFWSFPQTSGSVVSAHVRGAGSLLAVADGTPGMLFLHDRVNPDGAATNVAALGDSPRRVRVSGNIGAVSNFGSDNLTIFTWDAADNIAVTATVPVGDGPVGIDLIPLVGGQVAIVSTGFNDHSWSVTVIDAAGALVSNTKHTLPAGATNPGHAIWLDDEGSQVLVSCNTSGNVVVAASGL